MRLSDPCLQGPTFSPLQLLYSHRSTVAYLRPTAAAILDWPSEILRGFCANSFSPFPRRIQASCGHHLASERHVSDSGLESGLDHRVRQRKPPRKHQSQGSTRRMPEHWTQHSCRSTSTKRLQVLKPDCRSNKDGMETKQSCKCSHRTGRKDLHLFPSMSCCSANSG